jgi:dTMP kinase
MSAPGAFVVLEGLDGAGTTTQQELAGQWAHSLGLGLHLTAQPSDGRLGKLIRETLEGGKHFDKATLALLFAADRNEHLRSPGGILELLETGWHVLCDRYMLSTLAYQAEDDVSIDFLLSINSFARVPDATIFISTPPEVCQERLGNRVGLDLFEDAATQRRVYDNYLRLLERTDIAGKLYVIDGARDRHVVAQDVQAALREVIGIAAGRLEA